jgi:hypothetical protein
LREVKHDVIAFAIVSLAFGEIMRLRRGGFPAQFR